MEVDMRERPVVSGKDAQNFINRAKRNNLALARKVHEKRIRSDEYERNQGYRSLQDIHQRN
jgi:hypothetical protein